MRLAFRWFCSALERCFIFLLLSRSFEYEDILTPFSREMLANFHNVIMLFQIIFRMMQDTHIIEYLNLNNDITLETQINGPWLPFLFFQSPFVWLVLLPTSVVNSQFLQNVSLGSLIFLPSSFSAVYLVSVMYTWVKWLVILRYTHYLPMLWMHLRMKARY